MGTIEYNEKENIQHRNKMVHMKELKIAIQTFFGTNQTENLL